MDIEKAISQLLTRQREMSKTLGFIQTSLGRLENHNNQYDGVEIQEAEFKVFSQWGEDGIIQYLIHKLDIVNKIFIEVGVENYTEANTRFLLMNDNWSGLVVDGSESNINYIKKDDIYWRYNLKAEAVFINKDNINEVFARNGLQGEIGLLSIDIDGNDYWVWEKVDTVNPAIVIIEYNSLFGSEALVSIPYEEDFVRQKKHYSYLYYGASIAALTQLGMQKGYSLVYGNKNGNNLFFVRNDLVGDLKVLSPKEAYVKSQFREARDPNGKLIFSSFDDSYESIADLPVYDFNIASCQPLRQAQ